MSACLYDKTATELHGSETWKSTASIHHKLDVFHLNCHGNLTAWNITEWPYGQWWSSKNGDVTTSVGHSDGLNLARKTTTVGNSFVSGKWQQGRPQKTWQQPSRKIYKQWETPGEEQRELPVTGKKKLVSQCHRGAKGTLVGLCHWGTKEHSSPSVTDGQKEHSSPYVTGVQRNSSLNVTRGQKEPTTMVYAL